MAVCLFYKHGTSDECITPYCDICLETKGCNVKVYGYCENCSQYLCTDCHVFHKHVRATKQHTIRRGMDMPQSQGKQKTKFEICDVHSTQVKCHYCLNHYLLLCPSCSSSEHRDCAVLDVADTCKNITTEEINELYDDLHKYKQALDKTKSTIIANIDALKENKKNVLKEARDVHDKLIAKADKLHNELKANIEEKFKSEIAVLETYQKQIQTTVTYLESSLGKIAELKEKVIDANGCLKAHNIVTFTKKGNALTGNIQTITLSMEPSQIIKDFLSSSTTMGSVTRTESKSSAAGILPDIKFPAYATKAPPPLIASRTSKSCNTYNIKVADDKKWCEITGMAIMKNGNRILVDRGNSRMKMFSRDMMILSCLTLQDKPWDIADVSDSEVVVSMSTNTLVMVGISKAQLNITKSCKLSFDVTGIARCGDKFLITSMQPLSVSVFGIFNLNLSSSGASVKLIDLHGNVYWSLSHDQRDQPLFYTPGYLCRHTYGTSSTVIVTDDDGNSLTLVNCETGEFITRREGRNPTGITTDNEGNIYICYYLSHTVAVLNRDLSEERILLTRLGGIAGNPKCIRYDDTSHQLIISYGDFARCNSIVSYQLK